MRPQDERPRCTRSAHCLGHVGPPDHLHDRPRRTRRALPRGRRRPVKCRQGVRDRRPRSRRDVGVGESRHLSTGPTSFSSRTHVEQFCRPHPERTGSFAVSTDIQSFPFF